MHLSVTAQNKKI